ncbi:MAG: right-handed parallel beta-helix repeat-containing protein, partial [Candidatus Omnitrophota bacterium]|nr:right-handed parallel beta-helix repeat-containing protein [Candidatus Omnitrophota bacterium]
IIAHVDGNHYVVVNSVDQNTVTYVESTGREYTVPIDSFMVRFDGNALIAEEPPVEATLLTNDEMKAILGSFDAPAAIEQARGDLATVLGIPADPAAIAYLSHAVDAVTSYYTVEFAYPVDAALSHRYQANYDNLGKIISIIDVAANEKMYVVGTNASAYNYTTINSALAAVEYGDSYGDIVYITEGTYYENILIDGKRLTIKGNGTINAGAADAIKIINNADVEVEGLTIEYAATGIWADSGSILAASKNKIRYSETGIFAADSSTTAVIEGNEILFSGGMGIRNQNASLYISGNLIYRSGTAGIYDDSATALVLTIANNIITDNPHGVYFANAGTQASGTSGKNNIWGSTVDNYTGLPPIPGDFSSDPLYVDASAENFTLQLDSPCLAVNNPALTADIGSALERVYVTTALADGIVRTSDSYGNKLKDVKTGEYTVIYHYADGLLTGYTKAKSDNTKEEYNAQNMLVYETDAAGAKTLYVGTGLIYTTIQNAIDAASAGEKVFVTSGTYSGGISVTKNIEIIGEGTGLAVIDAAGNNYGIVVSSGAQVRISGFAIRNAQTA